MQQVIEIIQDYYENCSYSTTDFENMLKDCCKGDLIEFIMNMQCRGAFRGIVHA